MPIWRIRHLNNYLGLFVFFNRKLRYVRRPLNTFVVDGASFLDF